MARMVDGAWTDNDGSATGSDGRWRRTETVFRNWITADGSPGPTGDGGFAAAPGRYHLFVALNCPWAHRTLIMRALKGLQDAIGVSIAAPRRDADGWVYPADRPRFADPLLGVHALHQVYARADAHYTGRVTVPVLWDQERETIVSNESADIVRMLNGAFDSGDADRVDYCPDDLRDDIDALNARIYRDVNNGVYRVGFARTQDAYDSALAPLFDTLDWLDARLADRRYLLGDRQTEADWRLFPTLARFDTAYYGAFKCNVRRIADYAHLWPYARDLYQTPGIAETVDFDIYKQGYYAPSSHRNPYGIVPAGPADPRGAFRAPHGREQ